MINFRQTEKAIVDGLQSRISEAGITCPVIRANQTAPIPPYPYVSYTVTQPIVSDSKGYSEAKDKTRFKTLSQVWSITVQSKDDEEALNIAMIAYDWFSIEGNTYLSDNNIVVQRVMNVTTRDNLLSIEYEYRKGFDIFFDLVHEISQTEEQASGYIETVEFSKEV